MFICKIYKKTEENSTIFQNSFFQNNCFYHVYWIVFQNLAFSLVDRLISMAGIQTVSSRLSSFFKEKKTSVCSNYYLTQGTVCHTFAGTSSDERANSYHKSFVTSSLPCLKVAYQLKTEKKGRDSFRRFSVSVDVLTSSTFWKILIQNPTIFTFLPPPTQKYLPKNSDISF